MRNKVMINQTEYSSCLINVTLLLRLEKYAGTKEKLVCRYRRRLDGLAIMPVNIAIKGN